MGLFHLACAASGLAIVTEDVVVVLLGRRDGNDAWVPIAPPIRGTYDSYGRIENIDLDDVAERTTRGFTDLFTSKDLVLAWPDDPQCVPDGEPSETTFRSVLEDIRQGHLTNRKTVARGWELSYAMVLADVFDETVDMIADTDAGRAIEAQSNDAPFEVLVERTLGALATALVEDTDDTRTQLRHTAFFRAWFDREHTWSPDHAGNQYSKKEVRDLVRAARQRFARWPTLIRAVDAYERDSLRYERGMQQGSGPVAVREHVDCQDAPRAEDAGMRRPGLRDPHDHGRRLRRGRPLRVLHERVSGRPTGHAGRRVGDAAPQTPGRCRVS